MSASYLQNYFSLRLKRFCLKLFHNNISEVHCSWWIFFNNMHVQCRRDNNFEMISDVVTCETNNTLKLFRSNSISHVTMALTSQTDRSGPLVSASDCGVRGPRFESHWGRLCLSRQPLRYTALGTGCAPLLQSLGRLSLLPSVGR